MKCELIGIPGSAQVYPGAKEGAYYADFVLVGRATSGNILDIPPSRAFGCFKLPVPQDFFEAIHRAQERTHDNPNPTKIKITIETIE